MNTVILPVMLPMLTAIAGLLWGKSSGLRRWFFGLACLVQLGVALDLAGQAVGSAERLVVASGSWMAPLGIILVADPLSVILVVACCLMALACTLYGFAEVPVTLEHPLRLPLFQLMVAGVNLSFLTGDLFNLFVAFEIMLIASYALMTLESDDWDVRQAFPYLAINLFGSAFFLVGVGLAYGLFGTLNMADMAARAAVMEGDPRVVLVAVVLAVVFSIKAGVFPLYFWLPNSYPILATPLAAFFGGMLTKVGVYVLIRLFGTIMPHNLHDLYGWMAILAGFTMVLGVFGAVSRNFIRGILSWHIISQIGYMVLAIGFFTREALAAALLYVVHNIFAKGTLFLIGGTAATLHQGTDNLERMGGLWKRAPFLGVCFLFQALALAGVPPLSGFWGKVMIFSEGVKLGSWVLLGAALFTGLLTTYSMLKIWNGAFWAPAQETLAKSFDSRWHRMAMVITGLVLVSLVLGLGAGYFVDVAIMAVDMAMDQDGYIRDVMAAGGKGGAF
ncbi:MAG: proton-conducting transporter membrane subunit [Candidatus Methylacidiphilales bacterium]